jgi:hypothetical protein
MFTVNCISIIFFIRCYLLDSIPIDFQIMKAGYERDSDASAKALRAAVKNSKRDGALYGAVIKAESVFSAMSTDSPPPPPATPAAPAAPAAPAQASISQPAQNATSPPTSPPTMPPQSLSSLPRPVHPLMAALASGKNVLRPAGERPVTNVSKPSPTTTSSTSAPRAVFDEATIRSQLGQLKKVDRTIQQPKQPTKQEQLAADSLVAKSKLKPVNPRERNVAVTSSPPTLSELAKRVVDTIQPTGPLNIAPVVDVAQERVYDTLKPKSSSPTATTVASTYMDHLDEEEKSDLPVLEDPPTQNTNQIDASKKIDLYNIKEVTEQGTVAQSKAKEVMDKVNAERVKAGLIAVKSVTITALREDGTMHPFRMTVTKKDNVYQFILNIPAVGDKGKSTRSLRYKPDTEYRVDVVLSLHLASERINQGLYKNPTKEGNMKTGLGIGDPVIDTILNSPRVVFASRKAPPYVTRGQLYLMLPQLLKGHIRLYNRSGRPVVSRSNVSPSFQRIAKDIVERNTFEADDYSTLEDKETADANKFIEATRPMQPRNINRLSNADTIWQLKKRYEVLVGELSAGNTGKLVRDEMETILRSLMRLNAMSINKGRDLIKSLREF